MPECLICGNEIAPFIDFGQMPIANGFLSPDEFPQEYFYDLKVAFCPNCGMVQLTELVDREMMFHENYAFFSSTSSRMASHFGEFANHVTSNYLKSPDPFVVEIGSNDGIMLKHFAIAGIRHLGIEPSANVARVAIESGINTISEFFDENLAQQIVTEYGQADAFLGANVMCHIPYLHSVFAGIKLLLKPDGVLIFEDPYLGDIIKKTSYDQIYDEHAFYFSVRSISNLADSHGLEVINVVPQDVHGGSMRYVIAHWGRFHAAPAVKIQKDIEEALGLGDAGTYLELKKNIEQSRRDLMELLTSLKKENKRVVGYGATSKSTTVTNYCAITPDLVEFISDTTAIKQGKFSPGAHIPVRPYEEFKARYPDYALLFAWNHSREIMEKEAAFRQNGGKWILYVPKVHVA